MLEYACGIEYFRTRKLLYCNSNISTLTKQSQLCTHWRSGKSGFLQHSFSLTDRINCPGMFVNSAIFLHLHKLVPRESFGKHICYHLLCWVVLQVHSAGVDLFPDKVIFYFNVFSLTVKLFFFCYMNCRLVIFENHGCSSRFTPQIGGKLSLPDWFLCG